jgi:hypothetical protein
VVAPVVTSAAPAVAQVVNPVVAPVVEAVTPMLVPLLDTVTPVVAPVVHPVLAPVVHAAVPVVAPVIAPLVDAGLPVVGPTAHGLLMAVDRAPQQPMLDAAAPPEGLAGMRDVPGANEDARSLVTGHADRTSKVTRALALRGAADVESAPVPGGRLPLPQRPARVPWPPAPSGPPGPSGPSGGGRDLPGRMQSAAADAVAPAPAVMSAVGTSTRVRAVGASENSGSRPATTPD